MKGNAMGNSVTKQNQSTKFSNRIKNLYLFKEISLKESRWLANVTRRLLKIAQKIPKIAGIKRSFA